MRTEEEIRKELKDIEEFRHKLDIPKSHPVYRELTARIWQLKWVLEEDN